MDANQLEDISNSVKAAGADAVELLCVNATDVSTGIRNGKQEALERSEHKALSIRVWTSKTQAIVSSDDLNADNLKELIDSAVAIAKASPEDPYTKLADEALHAKKVLDLKVHDSAEPTVQELDALCHEAESAALAIKGVTNSDGARAGYGHQHYALMINPKEGAPFFGSYQTSSYSYSVSVLAGEGTGMEEDYEYSTKRFYGDLPSAKEMGEKAGKRVITRLNPTSIPTCELPIIWEPRVGKSLLGNFLSAINGSSIARGSSFLKDKMGEQIFSPDICIIDDPHMQGGLASKPFDGEGVTNNSLTLVENGVLSHWLLDVRSAAKLGLTTNGRARRGLGSPPSPGSTNSYMKAGKISPEDMLKDVTKGLFVTDVFGMGINPVTGDYSQGARGFLIENGEITKPVSEITIAGNLLDMFQNLTPASDLKFDYGTNVPTIRIDGMTVAGS